MNWKQRNCKHVMENQVMYRTCTEHENYWRFCSTHLLISQKSGKKQKHSLKLNQGTLWWELKASMGISDVTGQVLPGWRSQWGIPQDPPETTRATCYMLLHALHDAPMSDIYVISMWSYVHLTRNSSKPQWLGAPGREVHCKGHGLCAPRSSVADAPWQSQCYDWENRCNRFAISSWWRGRTGSYQSWLAGFDITKRVHLILQVRRNIGRSRHWINFASELCTSVLSLSRRPWFIPNDEQTSENSQESKASDRCLAVEGTSHSNCFSLFQVTI